MSHLLTRKERGELRAPENIAIAQLAKTLSEVEAFPGDSRYIAVPREWIEEAKKELGE